METNEQSKRTEEMEPEPPHRGTPEAMIDILREI